MRDDYTRHSKRVTSTRRWQVLRHAIMERDGWKCCCCGTRGRLEIDHIRSVRLAPDRAYDPTNLQALCGPCHTRKTRIECGHPAPSRSPEQQAWAEAVAELATNETSNT